MCLFSAPVSLQGVPGSTSPPHEEKDEQEVDLFMTCIWFMEQCQGEGE